MVLDFSLSADQEADSGYALRCVLRQEKAPLMLCGARNLSAIRRSSGRSSGLLEAPAMAAAGRTLAVRGATLSDSRGCGGGFGRGDSASAADRTLGCVACLSNPTSR